jgi:hypothetical protein
MSEHHCPACLATFLDYQPRLCNWCVQMPRDIVDGMWWDRFVNIWRRIGMVAR